MYIGVVFMYSTGIVYRCSCTVPVLLADFNRTYIFTADCVINPQMSNFMKIRLVVADLFHVDRQTDRHDESNGRFSQFWERA
jgi:hypothetical protein